MPDINYDTLADKIAEQLVKRVHGIAEITSERHLDIKGLKQLWGVGTTKCYELIKEHKLPILKIDGKTRIATKHAMRVIKENTVTPTS